MECYTRSRCDLVCLEGISNIILSFLTTFITSHIVKAHLELVELVFTGAAQSNLATANSRDTCWLTIETVCNDRVIKNTTEMKLWHKNPVWSQTASMCGSVSLSMTFTTHLHFNHWSIQLNTRCDTAECVCECVCVYGVCVHLSHSVLTSWWLQLMKSLQRGGRRRRRRRRWWWGRGSLPILVPGWGRGRGGLVARPDGDSRAPGWQRQAVGPSVRLASGPGPPRRAGTCRRSSPAEAWRITERKLREAAQTNTWATEQEGGVRAGRRRGPTVWWHRRRDTLMTARWTKGRKEGLKWSL